MASLSSRSTSFAEVLSRRCQPVMVPVRVKRTGTTYPYCDRSLTQRLWGVILGTLKWLDGGACRALPSGCCLSNVVRSN